MAPKSTMEIMTSNLTNTKQSGIATTASMDELGMIRVSKHPCLRHKISCLRSTATPPSQFRSLMREVTYNLAYEATFDLSLKDVEVSVCNESEPILGSKIKESVSLIPILRSGLGMVDAVLELVPEAEVHHIGMYTNKFSGANTTDEDSMPVQYYNKLPKVCDSDVAFVLDPVLASGNTAISVVGMVKKWGMKGKDIHVVSIIGSDIGLKKFQKAHPDVKVTVAAIDECKMLENGKFKFTGIGDAGDRLFGTNQLIDGEEGDEDETLISMRHKRKRTLSCDVYDNTSMKSPKKE